MLKTASRRRGGERPKVDTLVGSVYHDAGQSPTLHATAFLILELFSRGGLPDAAVARELGCSRRKDGSAQAAGLRKRFRGSVVARRQSPDHSALRRSGTKDPRTNCRRYGENT